MSERAKWDVGTYGIYNLPLHFLHPWSLSTEAAIYANKKGTRFAVHVDSCEKNFRSLDAAKRYAEDELLRILTEAIERLPERAS